MNRYGLILAGGRGTRFWPQSRKRRAKQVLNIGSGERTMIQATVDRLKPLLPPERIWILTNGLLRDEIIRQLPEVPKHQILAEPEQRNTAPAIGLAAHILNSIDPEAVMGVFPADHVIDRPKRFLKVVKAAFAAAGKGRIAVLGITPRWPETGYGYIELPKGTDAAAGPVPVKSFREKPDARQAKKYVAKGHFYWNAGMFFWRASTVLSNLRAHLPKTATLLSSLPAFTDRGFPAKLAQVFPLCENISIDYAILERASDVVGFACEEIGWSDVGSWSAVYDLLPRDADRNVTRSVLASLDSSGNYVDAGKKLVALLDVKDLIVVDTPDALLIANRHQAQKVGEIVKLLEKRGSEELL